MSGKNSTRFPEELAIFPLDDLSAQKHLFFLLISSRKGMNMPIWRNQSSDWLEVSIHAMIHSRLLDHQRNQIREVMKILSTNNGQTVGANSVINQNRRSFKTIYLGVGLFLLALQSSAQFVVEPFVSGDKFILESWYFNTVDEAHRLSIFTLNEASYDYNTENTSILSYGVVGYDLKGGFGPVGGWRMSQQGSAAIAGVQYGKYGENFLLYSNVNAELKDDPSFEFYVLAQFRPQITDKFKAFSQLQVSMNFTQDDHAYSLYRLRLGADLGKIQTGFGLEQTAAGPNWAYNATPGVFLRMELY